MQMCVQDERQGQCPDHHDQPSAQSLSLSESQNASDPVTPYNRTLHSLQMSDTPVINLSINQPVHKANKTQTELKYINKIMSLEVK